jgi:hypothetical protein
MALARAACHALKLQQQGFLAAPGLRGMAGEGLKVRAAVGNLELFRAVCKALVSVLISEYTQFA